MTISEEQVGAARAANPADSEVRPHGGRLSDILAAIAADSSRARISMADLFSILSHRAFGALMLIFAAPNIFPTPPGLSSILAAPLIVLTVQLALSRPVPWLPNLLSNRSISRAEFAPLLEKVLPWLVRAEKLLKPRLGFLTRPPLEQGIALVCLLLAVILFLPIPLGNMLPAISICLFSLAILERDGLAAILAAVITATSIIIAWGGLYAVIQSAIFIFSPGDVVG